MVNCAWCRHQRGRIDHPLCSADDMAQRWKDIADAGKGQVAQGGPGGFQETRRKVQTLARCKAEGACTVMPDITMGFLIKP